MREKRNKRSGGDMAQSRVAISDRPHEKFRTCSECEEDSLFLDGKVARCLSCGNTVTFRHLAMRYEGVAGICPKCKYGYWGYVLHTPADGKGEFICVACGFTTVEIDPK